MQFECGHDDPGSTPQVPRPRSARDDHLGEVTDQLADFAGGRLFQLSSRLAGIATDARPAVHEQLLDLIADVDALSGELRTIVAKLRHEGC